MSHKEEGNMWDLIKCNWVIIIAVLGFTGTFALSNHNSTIALRMSQVNAENINILKTDTKINENDIKYVKETVGKTEVKVDRILTLLSKKLNLE